MDWDQANFPIAPGTANNGVAGDLPLEPAVGLNAADLPLAALAAGPRPGAGVGPSRFCGVCGTPRNANQLDCAVCQRASTVIPIPLDNAAEWRAIRSAVALYFTLLAICAVGLAISTVANSANVELSLTVAITAVTLAWCIGSWRTVTPTLTTIVPPQWLVLAPILSLLSFAIGVAMVRAWSRLTPGADTRMSDAFLQAGYGWRIIFLAICIQPAVIEELAFRGVIFGALQKVLNPTETVVVTALMFMILHLSPVRFPHTLALGLGTGFMRSRTRSIYPGMLMHFCHNSLCIYCEYKGYWH